MAPTHVVVAGGGLAAGEVMLALRSLAADRVTLELITPDPHLPLWGASTAVPFGGGDIPAYDLRRIAATAGARIRQDAVEAVTTAGRRVWLASGGTATYDALVLAVGARARVGVPGAITFRDQRDAGRVAGAMDDLREGRATGLAIAIPPGAAWSLPAYELALQAASFATVTVVTPEREPLEIFGLRASSSVAALLADREVRVVHASYAREANATGVRLAFGGTVAADRAVALPAIAGRRIAGIPGAFGGFVPTDAGGRVEEVEDVWAAGDITTFPIKQGRIATQQADVVAAGIASAVGAIPEQVPATFTLRARLDGGGAPLFLRTHLDGAGAPIDTETVVDEEPPWWPAATVVGRHLAPWMAEQALVL